MRLKTRNFLFQVQLPTLIAPRIVLPMIPQVLFRKSPDMSAFNAYWLWYPFRAFVCFVVHRQITVFVHTVGGSLAPAMTNPTSAVRSEIRTRAKAEWVEAWRITVIGRITHRIIKKSIKNVLKKFKRIMRPESAVIVQARTSNIEIRDYLHKIQTIEFSRCSCEQKRQTVYHTPLKCSKSDELREKMWTDKRVTNWQCFWMNSNWRLKYSNIFLRRTSFCNSDISKKLKHATTTSNLREAMMKNDW